MLGVALPDVSDYRQERPAGKWSQLYGALARHAEVVGISQPQLTPWQDYLNLALSVAPGRTRWLARAGFNRRRLGMLNRALERELVARAGTYDLIVQLQTLCSPRSAAITTPYVVYTDNTMALTQRLFPSFAPLPAAAAREWERFEASVCSDAEMVFTCSEFARRSVVADYGCPPERVAAVGGGANQLLTSLEGRDHSRRQALFVGAQFERKGGAQLLEAWPAVRARVPDAELIVVGPREDPAPGFGQGVRYRGRIERPELAELYRTATVFVLPSLFEPWGFVFAEAMGHGLPCVASDCCAMPEQIEDGVTGRLVPPGESEPLAQALAEILGDQDRARRMGEAGWERVRGTLTWDHVVERMLTALSAVSPGGPSES